MRFLKKFLMEAPIYFLGILTLLLQDSYGKEFLISNLKCFNDYDSELTCSWEVTNSSSNCSRDFQLEYYRQMSKQDVCIPQNSQNGGTIVPNQCVCKMFGFNIVANKNFSVHLKSNGTSLQRGVFNAFDTVIPKAPRNVTVTFGNEEDIEVTWEIAYSGGKGAFLSKYLLYELQTICKQDKKEFQQIKTEVLFHTFSKRYFKSGCDWEVKVRAKHKDGVDWSDWSSAAEWHNDYSPNRVSIPSIIITVCCILLLLLILLCYYIITICKKKWWQNIPDPAKSNLHLIRRHISQDTVVKSDVNANIYPPSNKRENAKRTCSNWFNKLFFKAHHKKSPLSQDRTSKEHICRTEGPQYSILVPEVSFVEIATVEKHLQERKNSVDETKDIVEDKDDPFDLSISQMFQDIINDSPINNQGQSITRNTFTNSDLKMLPFFAFLEDHPAPMVASAYRSYPCDNSETDLETKSNQCIFLGMDQYSADQQDSIGYTPQESLYQPSETKLIDNDYANNGSQATTYCDSGYSSFASAVSGSENYSASSENFTDKDNELSSSSNCLSRSAFSNSNCSLYSDTTNSVYYNRQSRFILPGTSCDTSGIKMNVELTLTPLLEGLTMCNTSPKVGEEYNRGVSCPMNVCEVSDYQSFAEAIQQDETSVNHHPETSGNLVLESGYKSFESLLNQNTQETESDSDNDSFLCNTDMGVQKEEPIQNTGTNEFNNMKNTGGQTEIDFAEAPAQEVTFGFLNLHFTENCLDSGCKMSPGDKQPPSTKDSSDHIQDNAVKAEVLQNDFSLIYQGDNNCHLPFAWTHEQWENITNRYGPDFPKSSPVEKIDRIIRGSPRISYHADKSKSIVTETDIATFPPQPEFSDFNSPNDCQTMKFANMSYFVNDYALKTKLNDKQDELGTFSNRTPEHPKNQENEGCSYMQISLS
ncbi:hypothetical protein XENTR_v10024097 [Xenopus tropicalis]|nr:uncharacterized protein il4r isoform X2 [Xenopus tropicalis]KAE8579581.1 hypothetical protein XENTR_v10024097 [Xenopus tropicalis]